MGTADLIWTLVKYSGSCDFEKTDNLDPCAANHVYTYIASPIWGGLLVSDRVSCLGDVWREVWWAMIAVMIVMIRQIRKSFLDVHGGGPTSRLEVDHGRVDDITLLYF